MNPLLRSFQDAMIVRNVVARTKAATEFPTEEARKKYLQKHPKADPRKHTVKKQEGGGGKSEPENKGTITPKRDKGTSDLLYDFSQGGGASNEVARALEYGEPVGKSKIEKALKGVKDHLDLPEGMKLPGPNSQKVDHAKLKKMQTALEGLLK